MKRLTFLSDQVLVRGRKSVSAADLDLLGIVSRPPVDAVAQKAYFNYLDHGCIDGHDLKHWFEAEAQIIANGTSAAGRANPQRMP